MDSEQTKKYHFKAEIKKLLDILVHSLYTSREIFVRELISNSSDALDKVRFQITKGTEVIDKELPLEIRIKLDEKNNIITISDTGIGMSHDELIENIGTIAKSGSEEFLKQLAQNKTDANNIIGKFGVGFYSVFMAAKEVRIKSKSYLKDEPAVMWISDGLGDYEISKIDDELKRGTTIEIHLKEDAKEFSEKYRIQSVIKKYSNFITFPIYLDDEVVNSVSAIWREPKNNIKKEQYSEFYKFLTYDSEEPADIIHNSVDAPIQFYSLLFIPKKNDEFWKYNREDYGLDLYVRRVLIQHKNKELLPEYLSFVKGVVDSEDLPLNISRETLQENAIFSKIAKNVVSQILGYLQKKAKDNPEQYAEFWKEHGKIFKWGYGDFANHNKYTELLRFNSSKNENENGLTSLEEYEGRLKEGQKEIYFATGTTRSSIDGSPHVEVFKNKGLEVLYLTDPVDEFVLSTLRKYKDFEFKSVDSVDASTLEKFKNEVESKNELTEISKEDEKLFDSLLARMKTILGDRVKEVKESKRLVNSPSVLVTAEDGGMSAQLQKILKMTNKDMADLPKILEINKNHTLIRNLIQIFKIDSKDSYIENVVEQLYESALLLEGSLDDPHKLVNRLSKMMEDSSGWYLNMKK
ncbi:MAG: molecular chaperone HtpG [Syntrophothermus sp.]